MQEAQGASMTFDCFRNKQECECISSNCTGDATFCQLFHCNTEATCYCTTRSVSSELRHVTDEVLINPSRVTFDICLFQTDRHPKPRRKLLENEEASFVEHNRTRAFHDPLVICPTPGKLITRINGMESIFTVDKDLQVPLPFELLMYPQELKLIFVSQDGVTIRGSVFLTGKSECARVSCVFCIQNFRQSMCWPPIVRYILYATTVLLAILLLFCLRLIFKCVVSVGKGLLCCVLIIAKVVKSIARLCLLMGAFVGHSIQTTMQRTNEYLERNAFPAPNQGRLLLLALALLVMNVQGSSEGTCNEQNVFKSQVSICKKSSDGSQTCEVSSQVELTFKNLDHSICLWFTDSDDHDLFQLNLRLIRVNCAFSTKREYFTFPVEARAISQLSCAQNEYCSWGYHCHKGAKFEALTPEAESYPGYTHCVPSTVGSGCTIISRQSCLFYGIYFIPDLINSFEVKSITGNTCSYEVRVIHVQNNTSEILTVADTVTTSTGIKLEVQGALNQGQIFFKESLIQRVGMPGEAYLNEVSPTSRPVAGFVGQVQSNSSFSKHFVYDPKIMTCDFFETTLRCEKAPDFLRSMLATKDKALPMARAMHELRIEKGALVSSMLSTAPVKMTLHFANYEVKVKMTNVCPQIKKDSINIKGCYDCQILAHMELTVHSSCDSGVVSVHLVQIQIYTKTLSITNQAEVAVIQFMADKQCYSEKLCLRSTAAVQCELIEFCLDEPTLELQQLNTSYTRAMAAQLPPTGGLFHWFQLPSSAGFFYFIKLIGGILLITCMSITLVSTCLTCCTRR